MANDFNEVLYDTDGNLRDLDYIVSEYKKFFTGSEWENMPDFEDDSDDSSDKYFISIYNKDNYEIMSMFSSYLGENKVLSIAMTYPYEAGREKISEIMPYTKLGFKVFGSMYTKDKELL